MGVQAPKAKKEFRIVSMHGDNPEFWTIESIPASPSESSTEHAPPFTDSTEDTSDVWPLHDDLKNISPEIEPPNRTMEDNLAGKSRRGSLDASISLRDLYPNSMIWFLPFKTQREILVNVQTVLEESYADFASQWIPAILHDLRPQGASAGDSPLTTAADKKLCYQLPSNALAFRSAQSTRLAFRSAKELREAILEQNALDLWEIYNILDSATTIAEGLCNDTGAKRIRGLKKEIEQRVETSEAAGSEMRGRLTSQLKDIRRQREEIDRKEDLLTCEMLEKRTEEKAVLSQKIEAYLESNFEQVQKSRKT
ncbi:hypothetical protein GCG54_00000466 [Colletotrichum gloeosporioides]|uniref:Uncharacterized protein n=1 Tax=Colletotrichum gloeosporioides TaxID=474922 RepID=A0A8H4CUX9_COLGL|nr:uncharacterized protein GCG54_00000466 [Colletotrichum gloeosporioides]KAF3810419.1 hypothetical protein GCG54_00000466 [Colletotrichum gloeosporioides]